MFWVIFRGYYISTVCIILRGVKKQLGCIILYQILILPYIVTNQVHDDYIEYFANI